MLTRLRSRLTYANVAATLALFLALSTGGAYAFNEWTGANIVDESLTGADVQGKAQTSTVAAVNGALTGYDISGQPAIPALGQPFVAGSLTTWDINDGTLMGPDVKDGSLTTSDVLDGTLAARDLADNAVGTSQVANGSLGSIDVANNSLQGADVLDNSLTGSDVVESSLARVPDADRLDGIDSSGFQRAGTAPISHGFSFEQDSAPPVCVADDCNVQVTLPNLPAGTYAIFAKAVLRAPVGFTNFADCTLAAGNDTDVGAAVAANRDDEFSGVRIDRATLAAQVVHTYAATGAATLTCQTTTAGLHNIRITAIKLGQVTRTVVSP